MQTIITALLAGLAGVGGGSMGKEAAIEERVEKRLEVRMRVERLEGDVESLRQGVADNRGLIYGLDREVRDAGN